MLVLTRSIGKSVVISYQNREKIEKITITNLDTAPNKIKLGIIAPLKIPVYRLELYNKIKKLNQN